MYYRPEQWDDLGDFTIKYLEDHGLKPIYDAIVDGMRGVWEFLDDNGVDLASGEEYDDPDHPKNFAYELAWQCQFILSGMFRALLIYTEHDDYRVFRDLRDWGNYGVFY